MISPRVKKVLFGIGCYLGVLVVGTAIFFGLGLIGAGIAAGVYAIAGKTLAFSLLDMISTSIYMSLFFAAFSTPAIYKKANERYPTPPPVAVQVAVAPRVAENPLYKEISDLKPHPDHSLYPKLKLSELVEFELIIKQAPEKYKDCKKQLEKYKEFMGTACAITGKIYRHLQDPVTIVDNRGAECVVEKAQVLQKIINNNCNLNIQGKYSGYPTWVYNFIKLVRAVILTNKGDDPKVESGPAPVNDTPPALEVPTSSPAP